MVLLYQGFLGEQFGRCVRRQGQLRDLNSRFAARRAKTGAEVSALDTKFPVFASIAISNGMLYFGALDGQLTAVDLNTQKAAWVFQNDTSKQNLPAVQNADGTLNFGAIMSQNFYDHTVIAASKLLSIGSILSWPGGGEGCDPRGKHGRQSVRSGLAGVGLHSALGFGLRFCQR